MSVLMVILLHFGWISFCWLQISATIVPCRENRTEYCIQNLATFISLDNPRFATEAELDRLCREAEDGQRCSSAFLRSSSCVNPQDELHISLQIGRSQAVSQMMCIVGGYINDPTFRKLYLKHSPCIDEHQRKIKDCYISASVLEDPELEVVQNSSKTTKEKHLAGCCPMVQYIECSENAIGYSCGEESKTVVLNVLLKAAGKQFQEFCTNVDPKFPNSPDACTTNSNASYPIVPLSVYIILSNVIFLLYILMQCSK